MAIGYVGQLVYQVAPREPATWPHQVGRIPSRAQSFQRRAEIERLRTAGDDGGTVVFGHVLTGMGGVGKTQLAADLARTAWGDGSLDVLLWISAGSRAAVVTGYAQAGAELCQATPDAPEQAALTFLAWLTPKAGARPCRWLIVLDDVADPDDMRGLWPPDSPYGRTLVTTRRRDAALTGEGRRRIEVGLFTPAEAVAHLAASLHVHDRNEPADQLAALASDLGYLPLALAQAAAYLIDSGDDIASYRDLLADRTTKLADTAPDRLPDDQALPLAAAWSLSLDRANSLRPVGLARPMLQLAALLDPNGIPESVLTSEIARAHLACHVSPPDSARWDEPPGFNRWDESSGLAYWDPDPMPITLREAVGALRGLHRLHLIDHDRDSPHRAMRVHQLIQHATRDAIPPTDYDWSADPAIQFDSVAAAAADALLAAWPAGERDTDLAQALRAGTVALASHAEEILYDTRVHPVLWRAGESLGNSGQVAAAIEHYRHLAITADRYLRVDHFDTLTIRHNLARWQGEAGDAAGAAAATAEILEHMVRVRGEDSLDTLITRKNLAGWRGEAGDVAGAVVELEALLADCLRVLGKDNDDVTLSTRNHLAIWRGEAGDVAGAVAELEALLADRIRVLGEDHPHTLATRSNLAHWRGLVGDGGVVELEALLAARIRVLGEDHPETLTSRSNLANWRGRTGDVAGAVVELEALLAARIRVLGVDHPHTFMTQHNLAYLRGAAGEVAGATAAIAVLLEHMVQVLGEDHPDLGTVRNSLAYWEARRH
ncbi:tetratricopeptide repeat protein [Streptomyces sp. NPDC006514]|uniref:tetratricopeptide repeat protein n=1 Tax=Streptomyces sp. NPDC006514 TaxID=3154308 RepID=UPI00339DD2B9